MITSDNCRMKTPKYNSILPYLRSKEAEKVIQLPSEGKAVKSPEEEYNEARKEIVREAMLYE